MCYVKRSYYYITKTFVARNKFPHVKVAHNTEKVGQAWPRSPKSSWSNLYTSAFSKIFKKIIYFSLIHHFQSICLLAGNQ